MHDLKKQIYVQQFYKMGIYFINLLLLIFIVNSQTCENNSTFIVGQNTCACPVGFVGKTCGVSVYQLKDTQTKIPVDSNFTYAYFSPEQKVIYRFVLTICNANPPQILNMLVFAQQQKRNGEIQIQPKSMREVIEIDVGSGEECKQIYSTILVSMDKKQNGELQKIIFGFKLIGASALLKGQQIYVQCQTSSIFTVNFLVTILISFFVIITFFMLASVIFMLRKKWLQRRIIREQQINKLTCVNTIMPTKKYETLVEQLQPNNFQLICSICLCQFEKDQDVRKTPCGHIYHSSCLDSWCNAHFNCPICRKNFEQLQQQQQLQIMQQTLRGDNSNIRQPIL